MANEHHWALSAVVSEEFLNTLARNGIGDGIEAAEFRQQFNLPLLGSLDLGVTLTIVGVTFQMIEENVDRLHATIRATGHIVFHGDTMMPALPGLAHVRGDVLVHPRVELRPDGRFVAILDLAGSELVGMTLEGIDGVEADAEAQEMMGQMLFAAVGGELFEGLAMQMGSIGLELEADQGHVFRELGVRPSPADIEMHHGAMTVGLPAISGLEGRAVAERVSGQRVGVGVAAGALGALANRVAADAVGAPLPFELDVIARDERVGARIRNQKLVDIPFLPDMRPGFRSTVRPRLVGDQLELSLREAWLELPLVPPAVNRFNRLLGGVASLAPLNVSVPAHASLPVRPGSDAHLNVRIADLTVGRDGVAFVVEAHL
ncbi:MAG: hypothetical protein U0Q22_10405 [Acidimicrobiales bacterium]